MRLSVMLAAAALLAGGATYAADPASGTLTDTSGALSYTGGPFVVSNPTPDPVHAIDPQCVDGTPLCDTYVLTVDVGDGLRGDAANADALVSFRMSFTNALSDFDLYIYDSGGNLVASSTNGGGAPESTSVPLSDLKNGEYRIVIVPYNSAADSYEASVEITDLGNADKGGLLAAGAAGPGLLLPLLALAGLRRRIARLAPVLALGLAGTAFAADPATIDNTHASVAFSGGPYVLPNPSPDATDATGDPVCEDGTDTCDKFMLTVNRAGVNSDTDLVVISIEWPDANADFDLFVYDETCTTLVGSSAGGNLPEKVSFAAPATGTTYCVEVIPYLPLAQTYSGTATYDTDGRAADAAVTLGGPEFDVFKAQDKTIAGLAAQEPTIGINRVTNAVFMDYGVETVRTRFDDSTSPATDSWDNVTNDGAAPTTADPFFSDDEHKLPDGTWSPRQWNVQLASATSFMAYTDDEGTNWTKSVTGPGHPHGVDNESSAAGPYPDGFALPHSYPHAVYYCSHSSVNAFCSRSDDGGLTFAPASPIFPTGGCGINSNHGHVKVGADGTVYVPMNNTCNGSEGVTVSVDGGITWNFVNVPNTVLGRWDPGIGIASDGKTIYFGYGEQGGDHDGKPMIIKGTLNKVPGSTPGTLIGTIDWDPRGAVDVGAPAKLKNMTFGVVYAGDPDRAMFAFHGTTTRGDSGQQTFKGTWYMYVASTYDGGATWELRDVQPGDPTQKGGFCDQGIGCPSSPPFRNLLDFMDGAFDGDGRFVVGYADGCIRNCLNPTGRATYSQQGTLARQKGGKPLFAINDAKFLGPSGQGLTPPAPVVTASAHQNSAFLAWPQPYDGGKPLLGYHVLRAGSTGAYVALPDLLAVNGRVPKGAFVDRNLPAGTWHYKVQAFNSVGIGSASAPVSVTIQRATQTASGAPADDSGFTPDQRGKNDAKTESGETMCVPPGETVVEDDEGDPLEVASGAAAPLLDSEDMQWIAVSEPGALDHKIVFTLKVKSLADALPPQHRWVVYFTMPDGKEWYVAMSNAEGSLAYEYGNTTYTDTPAASVGQFAPVGTLSAESGYSTDGQIALVLDTTQIPGWTDDVAVDLIYGKVRDSSPNPGAQNAGITRDDTSTGFYQAVGNVHCQPKALPVAAFNASHTTGSVPITVSFDAATPETFVDTGASLVTYRWDFGDGSGVETTSARVQHVYTAEGAYRVTLQIVDSLGQASNFAFSTLLLGETVDSPGMLNESYSIFGGALPGSLLLVLGVAGVGLRRRR